MDQGKLDRLLLQRIEAKGKITVLTGAGISAESGIPTFRGPEGYWTVGSRVYQPQEMATWNMFQRDPRAVWQWYLYRLGICARAEPNQGHHALVELANLFQNRFTLITQNVDNLHLRAGQDANQTYEIHGNIFFVRCSNECDGSIHPLPQGITGKSKEEAISEDQWETLHCSECGQLLRPHVLWFDETYNEPHYRLESTLAVTHETTVLVIVGTSGATNLPNQIVSKVYRQGGAIIDINIASNRFGQFAEAYDAGMAILQPSNTALPEFVQYLKNRLS